MVDTEQVTQMIIENSVAFAPRILLAILTIIIGFWIVSKIIKGMEKALSIKKMDASLRHFLESLVSIMLKALIILAAAGMVGVETTSFIAILAAAGFAVGFALQGSLSNFAGGVMILLFKPYKVGDFVTIAGQSGTVRKIDILVTILKTPQNVTIYIPNGPAFTGNITNFSQEEVRRVDMDFGIGYGSDMKKAKQVLEKTFKADKRVLNEPAELFVAVKELGDSSVNLTVRAWVKSGDFWGLTFDMQEAVKEAFDKEGIEIPFPQMDVHMKNK
ncbi:MAG: mechanosensitive ion channel [Nanoarchaeota archaeon]|nr:mechanosensitive ion channel [Nanoarchaeota archaeon]